MVREQSLELHPLDEDATARQCQPLLWSHLCSDGELYKQQGTGAPAGSSQTPSGSTPQEPATCMGAAPVWGARSWTTLIPGLAVCPTTAARGITLCCPQLSYRHQHWC